MDPPWKRLVEELKDQGYESVYLDRLRASLDVEQQRAEALERRRELLIHREALGIRRNDILERLYPVADVPDV
jgi:endo-alpha-1,4-polygalactosaminidase (GH114 family)